MTKASPFRKNYQLKSSPSRLDVDNDKLSRRGRVAKRKRGKGKMDEEDEKIKEDLLSPLLSSPRHHQLTPHPGSPLFETDVSESQGRRVLEDMIFTTPPRKPPKHQALQDQTNITPSPSSSSSHRSTPTPPLKRSLQSPQREELVNQVFIM